MLKLPFEFTNERSSRLSGVPSECKGVDLNEAVEWRGQAVGRFEGLASGSIVIL